MSSGVGKTSSRRQFVQGGDSLLSLAGGSGRIVATSLLFCCFSLFVFIFIFKASVRKQVVHDHEFPKAMSLFVVLAGGSGRVMAGWLNKANHIRCLLAGRPSTGRPGRSLKKTRFHERAYG